MNNGIFLELHCGNGIHSIMVCVCILLCFSLLQINTCFYLFLLMLRVFFENRGNYFMLLHSIGLFGSINADIFMIVVIYFTDLFIM